MNRRGAITIQQKRQNEYRFLNFSLLELLIVIAIIVLLAGILMPALTKAKELSKRTTCSSNLKQFGIALYSYGSDFNNQIPIISSENYPQSMTNANGLTLLYYNNYLPSIISFYCPSSITYENYKIRFAAKTGGYFYFPEISSSIIPDPFGVRRGLNSNSGSIIMQDITYAGLDKPFSHGRNSRQGSNRLIMSGSVCWISLINLNHTWVGSEPWLW